MNHGGGSVKSNFSPRDASAFLCTDGSYRKANQVWCDGGKSHLDHGFFQFKWLFEATIDRGREIPTSRFTS